jgi:CDP-glucose 4,6-dehydratase
MLNIFHGKKVLITGHTGFKGSWLTIWLLKLGANITGFSDSIPTDPSLFVDAQLENKINHTYGDVSDLKILEKIISDVRPDFIFHLAAQAIVSTSYSDPIRTMNTNFIGTVNMLDCLRRIDHTCNAVLITSDKCYENVEWIWGYKETDHLGGKDIYSASKGAAEIAFHGYYNSFFKNNFNSKIRVATGRAGNVIGGGDWAKDRIVVDCIRSWISGDPVLIRSPNATRPWQHVLEPLSGYLTLAATMAKDLKISGESYNFGPLPEKSKTVVNVIEDLYEDMNQVVSVNKSYKIVDQIPFHEAGLLRLNCEKSLFELGWESTLKYKECISMIGEWYNLYLKDKSNTFSLTLKQIESYELKGSDKGVIWMKNN